MKRAYIIAMIGTLALSSSCKRFLTSREKVDVLRDQGFKYLRKKEFEDAAYYYAAALAMSQKDNERFVNDQALYNYGLLFSTWERYSTTRERLEDLLTRYRQQGNKRGEIVTLTNLGEFYLGWSKPHLALEFFQAALALAETERDIQKQCKILNYIGRVLLALKKHEDAFDNFFRSREMAGEFKNGECLSDAHLGLGIVWEKRKKSERAKTNYLLALNKSREIEYSDGEEATLEFMGKFLMNEQDYHQALSFFIPALILKQDIVDQKGSARLWRLIGNTYFKWGKYLSAQRAYAQSFRIYFDIKTFYESSVLLSKLGQVYQEMGKTDQALYYFIRSGMFFRTLGYLTGESRTLLKIARLHAGKDNFKKALVYARRGLKISLDVDDRPSERDIRRFLAQLYRKTEKHEVAIREMKEVMEIDEEIESDHTIEDARFLNELLADFQN